MCASLLRRIARQPAVQDLRFQADRLLGRLGRRNRCPQIYSVGLVRGPSPLHLALERRTRNPVISAGMVNDMDAGFVADPFWIRRDGSWWMFFEAWNNHAHKGEIACAWSADGLNWEYVGRVLRERFHLSYPYVFEHDGQVYMLPESCAAGEIRLYRATRFPHGWVLVRNLVHGPYCDATIFQYKNRWWIAASPNHVALIDDELHLFFADRIEGPWTPHPLNPVVARDGSAARPAGRPVLYEGCLIRFAQNCRPYYGTGVRAFEVTRLTPDQFEQRPLTPDPVLRGRGSGWNADGMHHIDPIPAGDGHWVACVDGWVRDPNFPTPGPPPLAAAFS